jgi:hypothetical protein
MRVERRVEPEDNVDRLTNTLPSDIECLAGQVSGRITDLIRDQPYDRPARMPLLGIRLGIGRAGSGHADHCQSEI